MLPKARMIAALEHREPDRVPVGELASDFEMTERILGRPTYYRSKWREYVAEWEGRHDEVAYSYGHDIVELARALEWDFVVVPLVPGRRAPAKIPEMLDQYKWRDQSGKIWQYSPETGGHAMLLEAPPMSIDDIVVPAVPAVSELDESRLEPLAYVVKELGGTHLIVGRVPEVTFPWDKTVGMEEFLVRMVTEPEFIVKATEAYVNPVLPWIDAMCDLGVDAIIECSDYCGNDGPLMGARCFRQFILPGLAEMARITHAQGKYFLKHTDGDTWTILDDLVAIGVKGWQGIQPSIGMELKRLKEKYGGRLCLFGGVNNETLIAGTEQEVTEEVRQAFRDAAAGGGYVLTSGNTLQIGTKYENYMAMLNAGRKFGTYPIAL